MKIGMFFAVAAAALLGASCSVQDFGTKVMDKPTIAGAFDKHVYGFGAPTSDGLMALENYDVITALYVGNPQSNTFTSGSEWVDLFSLSDGTNSFTFVAGPSNYQLYNRVAISTLGNSFFESVLDMPDSLPQWNNTYCFGGSDTFVSGVDTSRDIILYFNKPLRVTNRHYSIPVNYFSCPMAYRSYNDGYDDAQDLLYGGIFKGSDVVTLTYRKNDSSSAFVHYDGFADIYAAFKPYLYNGLLAVNEWLYNDRGGSLLPDWDGSSDVSLNISYYPDPVSIVANPLYIDVDVSVDNPDSSYCTYFTPMLTDSTTPMSLNFNRSFKGLVTDYYSYDLRYTVFGRYSFMFPAQPVQCLTNYIGVLSNYAAGYLDGVNSRNAEIADLSQRIIELQSDLSGYNGMTYDQIYELGRQAGINAGNAANSMMSGLFGAVLSVPLSIFGGLSDFSVLGVSVMSLIISLLVVAVAVMVLKRFL